MARADTLARKDVATEPHLTLEHEQRPLAGLGVEALRGSNRCQDRRHGQPLEFRLAGGLQHH